MPLEGWSLVIWAGAALVAVTSLARLMSRKHGELEQRFRAEWEAEHARRVAAEKLARKQEKKSASSR